MIHRDKGNALLGAASAKQEAIVPTLGDVLNDGTILELVRDDAKSNEPNLLAWDGKNATVSQQFDHNGTIYVPARLHPTVLRALRLPPGVASYGSTRNLFNDLCGVLIRYIDLAEESAARIAYFCFGTWGIERLPLAPFLSVVAQLGSPKDLLLRVLCMLCRRPLILAEASLATLRSLPVHLGATFLFDEADLTPRSQRLLSSTNSRGRLMVRNDQVIDGFSAKAICSREPLRDQSLSGMALRIILPSASRQLPVLEPETLNRIADEFQAKLLMYRLTNFANIRTPTFDVGELTVPTQDLARTLGSCIVGDEDLQRRIVSLLQEHDRDLRANRSTSQESVILEALIFCSHDAERSYVLCGELADIVNALWTERGESKQTTPESVGWKLRSLELRTAPIGAKGNGLRLTEEVRTRVHRLAREYGVPSFQSAAKRECTYCADLTAVTSAPTGAASDVG